MPSWVKESSPLTSWELAIINDRRSISAAVRKAKGLAVQQSLANKFFERVEFLGDHVCVRYKEGKGTQYQDKSWREFGNYIVDIAFGLAALGIEHKATVAIFSANSHTWVASDIATICNGGVSVPIYPTSSRADIQFILENSEARIIFVQNEQMLKRLVESRDSFAFLEHVVLMTEGKSDIGALRDEFDFAKQDFLMTVPEVIARGAELKKQNPGLVKERLAATKTSDLATIIYTSGTTGTPKGVCLTHANILAVVKDMHEILPIDERDVYLSYLPMSHVFERVCGEFYWLSYGGENAFAESIETMAKNMSEVQPTMLLVVPRVLDRIYAKVRSGIEGAPGHRRALIDWALSVGSELVKVKGDGKMISPILKAQHFLAEKLVLAKLRERIGPRLRLVVSGGAPATAQTIQFFNAIGIQTLEGYGLTETSAPVTVNSWDKVKAGTVGPALPSVKIRIADDGEILLSGESIFKQYYRAEQATAEAFNGEWFQTGDIGTIDGDGYLKITDRKKDLIVNSAGKNIAPQRIEAVLKTVPLVTQAVVFGDKQKALVALLTLDETAAIELGREKGWDCNTFAELIKLPALNQYLRKEIHQRSQNLADYEVVKKFAILPEDLSVEAGELTATLKIKRNVVANRYKPVIEALYRDETVDASALVPARR